MLTVEDTPPAILAQDIAPVLHQASHGIFAELLDTWKVHFPEYVCHLNRLETAYSKAPHGMTPLMPTS